MNEYTVANKETGQQLTWNDCFGFGGDAIKFWATKQNVVDWMASSKFFSRRRNYKIVTN